MAIYKEFAKKYLEIAKRDLEKALEAYSKRDYPEAVFHAQQAVEKSVKAMLEAKKRYVYNHGPALLALFEQAFINEWSSEFDIVIDALDYLTGFYTATRYPKLVGDRVLAPWDIINKDIAEKALKYAKEVVSIAGKYLEKKNILASKDDKK